jgi:hypothetical protein
MVNLAPEEYAQMIQENKPHLIEIESHAAEIEYGEMVITFTVRAGVVQKMEFHDTKTWLRPKS